MIRNHNNNFPQNPRGQVHVRQLILRARSEFQAQGENWADGEETYQNTGKRDPKINLA